MGKICFFQKLRSSLYRQRKTKQSLFSAVFNQGGSCVRMPAIVACMIVLMAVYHPAGWVWDVVQFRWSTGRFWNKHTSAVPPSSPASSACNGYAPGSNDATTAPRRSHGARNATRNGANARGNGSSDWSYASYDAASNCKVTSVSSISKYFLVNLRVSYLRNNFVAFLEFQWWQPLQCLSFPE